MSWFSSPLQLPTFPGAIGDPELGKGRMMFLLRLGPCKTLRQGGSSGTVPASPAPVGLLGCHGHMSIVGKFPRRLSCAMFGARGRVGGRGRAVGPVGATANSPP